jgi:endonuclease/exonuclease/phosphatase family metal-dependent hydrolase
VLPDAWRVPPDAPRIPPDAGPAAGDDGLVSFDPYEPYGPVVETTMRVVTWNVWGRYGDWEERQAGIEEVLARAEPDVVCLVETWRAGDDSQVDRVAHRLGVDHRLSVGDWAVEGDAGGDSGGDGEGAGGWTSGVGVVSRWPIARHEHQPLRGDEGDGFGEALFVALDGPRGPVQVFVAVLDYPLHGSALRQAQVRQLAAFVGRVTSRRHPTVVCGDFNAGPDSDEIRMLTGQAAVPVPGLVFYDAWELAGDGTPGHTWSNDNRLAAAGMYPDRRFDYVLSAWPRAGAAGHPTHCALLGVTDTDGPELSDHYAVLADLRY